MDDSYMDVTLDCHSMSKKMVFSSTKLVDISKCFEQIKKNRDIDSVVCHDATNAIRHQLTQVEASSRSLELEVVAMKLLISELDDELKARDEDINLAKKEVQSMISQRDGLIVSYQKRQIEHEKEESSPLLIQWKTKLQCFCSILGLKIVNYGDDFRFVFNRINAVEPDKEAHVVLKLHENKIQG
ncbi:hypothetical protein BgAZ_102540 [Babesia gibsoni]|uniref:Uncharacterized protein n=1 Tax=Babesia gibsoni TaxID=33632 RepID=A0AAD8PFH8_BABGI|nr:hypothetical protein BgAZ_102540 [Babesia gibsoni]